MTPETATQRSPAGPRLRLIEAVFPPAELLSGRLAASTVAMYARDCAAYVAFCGYDSALALQGATLRRWRAHLVAHTEMSPHTINRMLAAVKRVVQEAARQGVVKWAVAEGFAQVEGVSAQALRGRLKAHARVRIAPAEMRRLCEAPDPDTPLGLRDRALLATLAGSGCRISEVVSLSPDRIAARDGAYFVQVLGKRQQRPREAPLSREAYAAISSWIDRREGQGVPAPAIFTGFVAGGQRPISQPLTVVSAWRAVRKYARQCDLPEVKPHDFRRFVGTELAKRDLRQAQRALGHKRLETTVAHYVLDELQPGLTDGLY